MFSKLERNGAGAWSVYYGEDESPTAVIRLYNDYLFRAFVGATAEEVFPYGFPTLGAALDAVAGHVK